MLHNLFQTSELRSLARRRQRREAFKSVRASSLPEELTEGWKVARKNKNTVRLFREKLHDQLLRDRVWSLLYRLDFKSMTGVDPATIEDRKGSIVLEIVAEDEEVAFIARCISVESPQRSGSLHEVVAEMAEQRKRIGTALARLNETDQKRQIVQCLFTSKVILSDRDQQVARDGNILIFDEHDLAYYEALEDQLGPAARYQMLADALPGKQIEGLSLTLPAVKIKMGGYDCYSFAISPEYLLKIAYVSHRSKGKASDVNTYQRMVKKSRLRKIREYISEDGMFPTSIVVNVERKWLGFERSRQEGDLGGSTFGWLRLRPAYKVAWIIDGQHRLFAYSGHPRAASSVVSVLAFAGLPPSEQARLFVDINAEQRKVKQNLLYELYAELHWEAEDPEVRTRAVLSKTIQALDTELGSPFYGRILKADDTRSAERCISLTTVFRAMEKTGFFFTRVKGTYEFGPLWAEENAATLKRTTQVISAWFEAIKQEADEIWNLGAGEGGGLAMNEGVSICLNVLRSVFHHLFRDGQRVADLRTPELVSRLLPYGQSLGRYFGMMTASEMRQFRSLRGNQGQATGTRRAQQALSRVFPDFNPPGLSEFIASEKTQTNAKASALILEIESLLQRTVLEELRVEFGPDEKSWWFDGVPGEVRKKIDNRINEDQGKRGGREQNFDFIDYRSVVLANWQVFESIFGRGKGKKDERTKWIVEVNEIRKTAMHASRGVHLPVTEEQLSLLEDIAAFLHDRIEGRGEEADSLEGDAEE